MLKDIKVLLFDIDGTILDTTEFILQAFEHAFGAMKFDVPDRGKIAPLIGRHLEECYRSLAGEEHLAQLVEHHKNFQDQHGHLSLAFPGAMDTLAELKKRGYKMAAVTTRFKRTAHATLEKADALQFFDAVIYGDEVTMVKPDPEPLFKALKILGEQAEAAAMIGDTAIDVLAGKNAGTKTVRATYGFNREMLHEPEPDHFIDDIKDLLNIL